MASRSERLARLAGSGKGWGGGLPLPQLFAAILNELLDNEIMTTARAVEIATDVMGFKVEQIVTNQAMGFPRAPVPDWEAFTDDVLAQMDDTGVIRRDGEAWRTGGKFATDTPLVIIPAGRGRRQDGVTVWSRDEREARSHAAFAEGEATSLIAAPRPIDSSHVREIRDTLAEVGQQYPVLTDANGRLLDGRHRREADPEWRSQPARKADGSAVETDAEALAVIRAVGTAMPLPDDTIKAIDRLLGDLSKSNAIKRDRIEAELMRDASRSNRLIAEVVGCAHPLVGEVRSNLEDSSKCHVYEFTTARTGKHSATCWCGEGQAEPKASRPVSERTKERLGKTQDAILGGDTDSDLPSAREVSRQVGHGDDKTARKDWDKLANQGVVPPRPRQETAAECTHCCPKHCPS